MLKALRSPWFSFAGKRSDEMGALLVAMPSRQHPVMQGDKTVINGRDGFVFVPKNQYNSVNVKIDFVVPDNRRLQDVLAWLSGSGELIISDFPDQYYEAYVLTSFTRTSVHSRLEGQKISVSFTCQPFRKEVSATDLVFTEASVFSGSGDVYGMPLLKCEGNGTVNLMLNGDTISVELTGGTPLYLDCEAKVAYTMNGTTGLMDFAGNHVRIQDGSDWFRMLPDTNNLNWSGTLTRLTISPRWRWF